MLDNDTVSLLKRRVFDIAGSTHKSVKVQHTVILVSIQSWRVTSHEMQVYLDGKKLPVKTFKEYVDMFRTDKEKPLIYEKVGDAR